MDFYIYGVNHHDCPVEVRETLHFSPDASNKFLRDLGQDPAFSECLVLSTCNRVEFIVCGEDGPFCGGRLLDLLKEKREADPGELRPFFYRREGREAIRHLFRVAAGLDSLVVGENEILGQMREAFRIANEAGTVHSRLFRLFEKALKLGKEIRTKTKINEGAVSIPSVAVELAEKIFGKLSGEKVMVIGTGEMSELALKNLKNSGADILYVVSRNPEKGEAVASRYNAERLSFEDWPGRLAEVDILITSTAAPHPIVQVDQVKKAMAVRRHRPLFMMDIAVPRDIEAEVHALDDVYLYNIDDLKAVSESNLKLRRREIAEAEHIIEEALHDFQGWIESLKARPTLEQFENFLSAILQKEMAALQGRVEPKHLEQVQARIRAKLMHPALEKIKEASRHGSAARYLETLHLLFDLEEKRPLENLPAVPQSQS